MPNEVPNIKLNIAPENVSQEPKKRGRPQGTTNAAKNSTVTEAEIKQALSVMDSLYKTVESVTLLLNLPIAHAQWLTQQEGLQESNRKTLQASPALVKWLNKTGNGGGTLAFIGTNALAFAMFGRIVQAELAMKRAEFVPTQEEQGSPPPDPNLFQ